MPFGRSSIKAGLSGGFKPQGLERADRGCGADHPAEGAGRSVAGQGRRRWQCTAGGVVWFVVWAALLAAAVCGHCPETLAAGELKIVYNTGVAPLKFDDPSGKPAGLLPETWRFWSEKTGRPIEFVRAKSFDDSLEMVKDGRADLHAGLFKTPEREEYLAYSSPLFKVDYYIFTHPSLRPISSPSDLAGLAVGIPKGGYTGELIDQYVPGHMTVVFADLDDMFQAALKGDIKVFVATEISLLYFLDRYKLANIFGYYRDNPLYSQVYYTASAKKNAALIDEVNQGLASHHQGGL